jgi:hypothetical protein
MLILPGNLVFLPLDQYLMTYGYISERIRLSRPVIKKPPISLPSGCASAANGSLHAFRSLQHILEPACRLFTINQPFAYNV